MIELLFVTGILSQLVVLLCGQSLSSTWWYAWLSPSVIMSGILLSFLFSIVGEPSPWLLDSILMGGMVFGVLVSAYIGLFSLEMMRGVSPVGLSLLHLLMIYAWIIHPSHQRFFVWEYLLPVTTVFVLLTLMTKLRGYPFMRGVGTLWYFCLLVFFSILFFSPLTEVYEPSPTLALFSGTLFVPLLAYAFFALKYLLMVISSVLDISGKGMSYLSIISSTTFPERQSVVRQTLLLLAAGILVGLRYMQWINDEYLMQFGVILVIWASVTPSEKERKKVAAIAATS